jgi:sporulation-control protein spo0M
LSLPAPALVPAGDKAGKDCGHLVELSSAKAKEIQQFNENGFEFLLVSGRDTPATLGDGPVAEVTDVAIHDPPVHHSPDLPTQIQPTQIQPTRIQRPGSND